MRIKLSLSKACAFLILFLLLGFAVNSPVYSSTVCDVDDDCNVDMNDVNQIIAARNTPASGPDDPRDADGDGMITVLDARTCILQCTQPRCVIVPPECDAGPDADNDGVEDDSDICPETPTGETVDSNGCSDSQLAPTVTIISPETLTTVGSSPIDVSGTVSDDAVSLFVNGVEAVINSGSFAVTGIVLNEGMNVIAATAYDAFNNVGTANANIHLDSTPPEVFINSPSDGAVVTSSPVIVTGLINDIVRGTVNKDQASVAVNGIDAAVSNRNFIVESVPLVEGENTITAIGADQTGNTASISIAVTLDLSVGMTLNIVSGNNQTATVGTQLLEPFVASVIDENGAPVAGRTVVFRCTENNGSLNGGERALALETDANGQAQVVYTLGTWAGAGNNKVEVSSTGIQSSVTYIASGTIAPAENIHVASGSQQRGGVNQPLPEPLVAIVTDIGHNPAGDVPVTFNMKSGGGKFSNDQAEITVNTDSDGRATVPFTLGPEVGNYAHIVEASFPGNAGNPASFLSTGLAIGDPGDTKISGVVLDNSNNPIPGVTMRVEGTTRQGITDDQGAFMIDNVPVGPVHLIADGSTATIPGEFPTLAWELVTVAGQNNTLGMPVFLLPLNTSNIQWVGGNEDVVYMLDEIPGFSLIVKANSVTFPDGSNEGYISVTQVHADKVPMPPPNGLQPRFIVTIQPPGAVFDPPAPITLPNVDGLAPNEITTMYSFDHDLGQFVSIGTGTVTDDGMMIISDPGVGVVKAGWHCGGNPQPVGGANNCPDCQKCNTQGNQCEPDNGQTPSQNAPDDCKKEVCQGGSKTSEADDSETPADDCEKCQGGSPELKGPECGANSSITVTYNATTITAAASMTNPAITSVDQPTFTGSACLDTGTGIWRYRVNSVTSTGTITIVPTPAANTPNPVDGGNIVNNPGATGHYCDVISDLADYTATGGKGPGWHVTQATIDHENYHWETEWQTSFNNEWGTTETTMEGNTVSCSSYDTAADAKAALEPQANTDFLAGFGAAAAAYNALGDGAGDPPYVAGQAELNAMIANIETYATSKGWPACP